MFVYRKAEVGMAVDMIYEKPTTERNGVKVIIPIRESDYKEFKKSILEKCAYFEQVYFQIEDKPYYLWNTTILEDLNNFTILDTPHFKYSTLDESGYTKILLGRINYKLSYQDLGIPYKNIPIALKFGLTDGIYPSPNRETVKYTTETKILVLKKLRDSAEWLINKFNEQVKNVDTVSDWLNYFREKDKYVKLTVEIEGEEKILTSINISEVVQLYVNVSKSLNTLENTDKYDDYVQLKSPVLEKYPLITSHEHIFKNHTRKVENPLLYEFRNQLLEGYHVIAKLTGSTYTTKGFRPEIQNIFNVLMQPEKYVISSDQIPIKGGQREYLKEKYRDLNIISPRKYTMKLGKLSKGDWGNSNATYIGLLQLHKVNKKYWRQIIQEWQGVEQEILDKFHTAESVKPTKEWIEENKESKKKDKIEKESKNLLRNKLKEEVNLKLSCNLEKWSSDWNCKFESKFIKIADLHKLPYLVVYSTDDDRYKLDRLYRFVNRHLSVLKKKHKQGHNIYQGGIRPAILGQRDIAKLKEFKIHNIKSIEQFMSEHGKLIGKYVTARKVYDFLERFEINKLRAASDDIKEHISERFAKNLDSLYEYKEKYRNIEKFTGDLADAMTKLVEENNYWDLSILAIMKEIEQDLQKLDFLHLFIHRPYSYSSSCKLNEEAIPLIHEILRNRKFRMDSKHYPKIQNLTETSEEELIEQSEGEEVLEAIEDLLV